LTQIFVYYYYHLKFLLTYSQRKSILKKFELKFILKEFTSLQMRLYSLYILFKILPYNDDI